jgi:hypothetical protein
MFSWLTRSPFERVRYASEKELAAFFPAVAIVLREILFTNAIFWALVMCVIASAFHAFPIGIWVAVIMGLLLHGATLFDELGHCSAIVAKRRSLRFGFYGYAWGKLVIKMIFFVQTDNREDETRFLLAGFFGGAAFAVLAAAIGFILRDGAVAFGSLGVLGLHTGLSFLRSGDLGKALKTRTRSDE